IGSIRVFLGHAMTIWPIHKRHRIDGTKSHANIQSWRFGADSRNGFTQEARTIFKTAAITPFAIYRREKFVTEITVAVFDIDEIEACLLHEFRCTHEVFDQA